MKVAITAASGQLGSEIVQATAALVSPENVVGLARTTPHASHLDVEIRPGDYDQPDVLVASSDRPEQPADRAGRSRERFAVGDRSQRDLHRARHRVHRPVRGHRWHHQLRRRRPLRGYTTRPELAYAYARMLTDDRHDGHTDNLHGEAVTQFELADHLNRAFGTDLTYTPVSVAQYCEDRVAELGDFIGTVIAGIYVGIRNGDADNPTHYADAASRGRDPKVGTCRHSNWLGDRLRPPSWS